MRIGVLGGGQLGRMLAIAGIPMGFEFRFLEPAEDAPIRGLGEHVVGAFDDSDVLAEFAVGLDVATYEFENVPVAAARSLAERVPVRPSPDVLAVAQDRVAEKELFARLGISTAVYEAIDSEEELARSLERVGAPALAKTRRLGYDGRGQVVLRGPKDVAPAWRELAGTSSIVESRVPFDRELSILAVGGANGERAFYPLVENRHREGILRLSLAPAPGVTQELQAAAESIAEGILKEFGYIGVLAVELFDAGGELLANELAPRVHNSGHWTIEGAETSQFENHVRAVAGLPLGSTQVAGGSATLNLIGAVPHPAEVLSEPRAHLHLYGKAPRHRRKLGHVTLRGTDAAEVAQAAQGLAERLPSDG
jgi:5-(carboxyamino)imidazole ribonucleotide synthase